MKNKPSSQVDFRFWQVRNILEFGLQLFEHQWLVHFADNCFEPMFWQHWYATNYLFLQSLLQFFCKIYLIYAPTFYSSFSVFTFSFLAVPPFLLILIWLADYRICSILRQSSCSIRIYHFSIDQNPNHPCKLELLSGFKHLSNYNDWQ